MTCLVCGSERYRVVGNPTRFPDYEVRRTQCPDCGTDYELKTTVSAVFVIDPDTLKETPIPPIDFHRYRDYKLGRGPHPKARGVLE